MDAYVKLRDSKSGEVRYFYEWRRLWSVAKATGELAKLGLPENWAEFEERLLPPENSIASGAMTRKRRPGGGRKPKPDKLLIRQICLSKEQAEAVKQAASAAGISQSAWIRQAIDARLA